MVGFGLMIVFCNGELLVVGFTVDCVFIVDRLIVLVLSFFFVCFICCVFGFSFGFLCWGIYACCFICCLLCFGSCLL